MAMHDPIVVAHLWSKVEIPTAPRHNDLCWNWRGSTAKGYGQIRVGPKVYRAHRLAYEAINGDVPEGLHVLHSCDNPLCCNPYHLRTGTHQENMDDKAARLNKESQICASPYEGRQEVPDIAHITTVSDTPLPRECSTTELQQRRGNLARAFLIAWANRCKLAVRVLDLSLRWAPSRQVCMPQRLALRYPVVRNTTYSTTGRL